MSGFASADTYYSADTYLEQDVPSSVKGYRQLEPSVSNTWEAPEAGNKVLLVIVHDDQHRYRANTWIEAVMSRSDDMYIARNERLRLFGDGASGDEAIEDLSRQIAHFYKFYGTLDADHATQDALEFKQLYQNLLIELG